MTTLCNIGITAPLSAQAQTVASGQGAPTSVTLQARFTYVSGGTGATVDAWVQTTLNGGITWVDIANFHFTTAGASVYQNCIGAAAISTAQNETSGALAANTAINGILGDQYRVVVTSTGTYTSGTQLVVDAFPRY